MNLLTKMREVKDLTPSEQHIVAYIFANLNDIVPAVVKGESKMSLPDAPDRFNAAKALLATLSP